jgi:hypothetical protein
MTAETAGRLAHRAERFVTKLVGLCVPFDAAQDMLCGSAPG